MRPAGQHRRRQAQLLSPYSSSFCNFSGKNISFVRTPFSVSSLLLISVTVPVSLLAIVTDDTSPLFILHICLFVPGPHCLTLYVLLGNSLPLPKPCSHIFFSSLCQVPCLISLYSQQLLVFLPHYLSSLVRSVRTSCTTSGGFVRLFARSTKNLEYSHKHTHICLMNHQKTHHTNPMAPWDPLDASLDPLGHGY